MASKVGAPSRRNAMLGSGSGSPLLWPSGLRSLRVMLENLHTFFNFEREANMLRMICKKHKDQSEIVSGKTQELLADLAPIWNGIFNKHGLLILEGQTLQLQHPLTYSALQERLRVLLEQFHRDTEQRLVYVLDEDAYNALPYFDEDEIKESFESSWPEIKAGLDCYALDQHTACVFHFMRAVEHLLRLFVTATGVRSRRGSKPLEYQEWHPLIEQADSKVSDFLDRRWKNTAAKKKAMDVLRASIADFYAFKDNVRNDLMHSRSELIEAPTALAIINRVHKCFTRLLPYLNEDSRRLLTESVWSKSSSATKRRNNLRIIRPE